MRSDLAGLPHLLAAFGTAGLFAAGSVVVKLSTAPAWLAPVADAAPWQPGEPLPLARTLLPTAGPRVVEDDRTGLVVAATEAEVSPPPPSPATGGGGGTSPGGAGSLEPAATVAAPGGSGSSPLSPAAARLPDRPPTVPTPLTDPGDRGLEPLYRALARGDGLARIAWWGDSTIAADGITGTVRARLQARFGYGGPGFVVAGLDPQWSARPDLGSQRAGDWATVSILLGGARGMYGYGGIVSTAPDGATLSLRPPKGADGKVRALSHAEVWYQAVEGGGRWWMRAGGGDAGGSAAGAGRSDQHAAIDVPGGYDRLTIGASGGPVPFYGVVMETAGPGVVLDALGVVGVGTRSFKYFGARHIAAQVAQRRPDLVVLMLGGNELGLPVLQRGEAQGYDPLYTETLRMLRAGAPAAGCLVVTPLDQGTREGGTPGTKPSLKRLVAAQRRVAEAEGCAFWSGYEAMGGEGSIVAWTRRKPPLAWTDLLHLSAAGQDLVGQALADAIELGFDDWVAGGGPARMPAVAPEAVPAGAPPTDTTPGNATPGDAMPGQAPPGDATPGDAMPRAATPGEATPREATPREATTGAATPGGSAATGEPSSPPSEAAP
jgi:lysophospholipase L1-like esterase